MHCVLEVKTLFYMDMLIKIWQVIKIVGRTLHGCFYCRWNKNKLDFETIEGCFTFNNENRVCCYYRG
jgi:hypothetical protein